jgi:hypothetical protein
VFHAPEDTETEDPTLPAGSIAVELRDPDDKPVAHELVTLGVMINSVAKGDSRRHIQQATDDAGRTLFSGLETSGNTAFRVSAGYQGGAYAAMPFQMAQGKSMHVVLHVYPVTRDVAGALIVAEATVAAELRDDRIQIEEAFTIYNLGRTAWQPDDVRLALPSGFTAFNAQASMSDQGVDAAPGGGRLRGTFSPGQHAVEFRWQLPWSGASDVDFNVGLPPHTAIVRLMLPASGGVRLVGGGFPAADTRKDSRGQSFLVTERRALPDGPRLTSVDVGIRGLPSPGPGPTVATVCVAIAVVIGLFFAFRKRATAAASDNPQSILDDLLALERALEDGEIGPRTYERAKRARIDALALALART